MSLLKSIGSSLLVLILMLMPVSGAGGSGSTATIEIKLRQSIYQVELAMTPSQRRKGLMYRQRLAADKGMLLVYPRSGDHRVWMKNMLIPLRVLWIDDSYTVLSVQRLVPCETSPCPVFAAPLPSRYILELSDGNHDIKPGDKVEGLKIW